MTMPKSAQILAFALMMVGVTMAQQIRNPDVAAQRAAMQKLSFLVGHWSGEAHIWQDPAHPIDLKQTEVAQYKLDGMILTIEGVGKTSDGKPALQAFGAASYDDATGKYHMHAFNDGRWLETDVELGQDGRSLSWGFDFGQIRTHSVLRINEKNEWTEEHQITISNQPARKLMEVRVAKEKQ